MKEEDINTTYSDRLERLLTSPDDIPQEELERWMSDAEFVSVYQTAMDARRSLLSKHAAPDAHAAFLRFREEQMQSSVQPTAPHRYRLVYIWAALSTAACIVLLCGLFFWRGVFGGEKTVVAQQGQRSVRVFTAKSLPNDVTLSAGGKDIALGNSTDAQLAALSAERNGKDALRYGGDAGGKAVMQTLTTPQGKDFHVTLSDGTQVWLNAESSITYPSRFEGSATRTVSLRGEAYFEVAKDKTHPFIVSHNGITTRVTGTSFNIRSYAGEQPHVTLASGSVSVSTNGHNLTLTPGQDATVGNNGALTSRNVDIEPYVSWREGYFYFDGVTFRQMMMEIGRWYKKNVVFSSSHHLNELLHLRAERSWDITDIIEQINQISDTKVRIKGNTIIVE